MHEKVAKYIDNTLIIHREYIDKKLVINIPEHIATTCSPMLSLSRKSFGKFNIETDSGHIVFPLLLNMSAPSQQN